MGRSFETIRRTKDLTGLFRFFGVEAQPALIERHQAAISDRFTAEVQEIVRLCTGLREKERYKLFREALRLSYESALVRAAPLPTGG